MVKITDICLYVKKIYLIFCKNVTIRMKLLWKLNSKKTREGEE